MKKQLHQTEYILGVLAIVIVLLFLLGVSNVAGFLFIVLVIGLIIVLKIHAEENEARLAGEREEIARKAAARKAEEARKAEAARKAEEARTVEAAKQATTARQQQAEEAAAALSAQLKAKIDAIPPTGREVATQNGQRLLFDYAAKVIPALEACKAPPHRAARLYTENIDNLDALLSAVSGVLEGTARIISTTDFEEAAEAWPTLSEEDLLKGYKALRCYEEISEYSDDFKTAANLLAETIQSRQ